MEITTVDVTDGEVVAELLALHRIVHETDQPDNAGPCGVRFPAEIRSPSENHKIVHRVAKADSRIVAHLRLDLPLKDNTHASFGDIIVHPEFRRQGIGRALMGQALEVARAEGRRTICMDALGTGSWENSPKRSEAGLRFLEDSGFKIALTSIDRRAQLAPADPEAEQRHYEATLAASEDYETVAWNTRVPEELLAPMAKINSTFLNEAPLGDLDVEAENFDADRIRKQDDQMLERGMFMCGVVARLKGSEEIAATTVIGMQTEPGDIAQQWLTLVSPDHRGHKLGLRLKIENHRQLRRLRPAVSWVKTDNAEVNAHMIAINEIMGFEPIDYLYECQLDI